MAAGMTCVTVTGAALRRVGCFVVPFRLTVPPLTVAPSPGGWNVTSGMAVVLGLRPPRPFGGGTAPGGLPGRSGRGSVTADSLLTGCGGAVSPFLGLRGLALLRS